MDLIVAEKTLVAERIAAFLAVPGEKVLTKRDGNVVQYLTGNAIVMGLKGHVVELDFVEGYTNWRSKEHPPRSLIDAPLVKNPSEGKIVAALKRAAKIADKVIIATDFDREGELIGKEAVELIRSANKTVPIYRARFSAVTKEEILTSLADAKELDVNLAASGESRQIIDLVWGASLTRFLTIAAHRSAGEVLSAGRVQSPTLAMIVDKEREIEAFVPEKYWMLTVAAAAGNTPVEARHTAGKFFDKAAADAAYAATNAPLKVTEVITGHKTDKAPTPLDTTALIVGAGRLGISAASAMNRAEELYMRGFISYPRTDNTTYPKSLKITEHLNLFAGGMFSSEVKYVKEHMRAVPTRGKKETTDHPPIYPTGLASPKDIEDPVSWKLYEFVVRRFFATLCTDAEWETMKVNISAAGEPYTSTGGRILAAGWRTVYPYSKAEENILPQMAVGDTLVFNGKNMEEKETLPPARYSQSKLIQKMEELGLGTKSTRHDVISKLMGRKYIEGNPLKPTIIGRAVTEALEEYAPTIAEPDMTKTLEEHMTEIAAGTKTLDAVLSESRGMLSATFDTLEMNAEGIGTEIMNKTRETQLIGPCPVCGKPLAIRHANSSQFIGCTGYPECTFNIGLPPAVWGNAVKTDEVCAVHGVNHVQLIRKGAPPWKFGCPVCSHIANGKEILTHMPGMTEDKIIRLHAAHIYSAYDISMLDAAALSSRLQISPAEAAVLKADADKILETLKKRADLKKFMSPLIPYRRKRSPAKVISAVYAESINDIRTLADTNAAVLVKCGLSEEEAKAMITAARDAVSLSDLKESGIPAVSLKKYVAAGYDSLKKIAGATAEKLSKDTGIKDSTAERHRNLACAYLQQMTKGA
ncbi:MAG TPA: DNA topoisomerase I [Methanocorpusculum sp.]|nr:DNA topoisomerase I [Methanocorpusculum sp.]